MYLIVSNLLYTDKLRYAVSQTRLITPPREEEEIYPYHKVWRSIVIESILLVLACTTAFLIFGLLRLNLPSPLSLLVNVLLAIVPAVSWYIFSYLPEQRVQLPRTQMGVIFVLSFLVANAIGVPLVFNVLRPAEWLATESTLNRIIGYTLSIGIVHEILKYLVLRYTVWTFFRIREDSIAYALAVAIPYAVTLNLYDVLNLSASPDSIALRVLANTTLSIIGSLIISYGLSETLFSQISPLLLPATWLFASLIHGVAIPIRSGIGNATLGISATSPRPLFSLGFSIVLYIALLGLVYFGYNVQERREANASNSLSL